MSDASMSEPEAGSNLTNSQVVFQQHVAALGQALTAICAVTGVPAVMAALAASQIIRAVISDLAQSNPATAKQLLEELAAGLVEMMGELGVEIESEQMKQ